MKMPQDRPQMPQEQPLTPVLQKEQKLGSEMCKLICRFLINRLKLDWTRLAGKCLVWKTSGRVVTPPRIKRVSPPAEWPLLQE